MSHTDTFDFNGTYRKGVFEFSREPQLLCVREDDRIIVRNILYCIGSLNAIQSMCETCDVVTKGDSYILTCKLSKDWSIGLPELQAIVDVNPCRVASVLVSDGPLLCVRVLNSAQPIMYVETDIVRIRKKARGWSLLGQ
jgi:hypothetical protein